MKLFLLLIGMVLVLESLPYVAAPEAMKGWLKTLSEMHPGQLRRVGCIGMLIGFLICWVVQKTELFS